MSEAPGDGFTDRWLRAAADYRCDLDRCQPSDAIGASAARGRWRTVSYTAGDLAGTLLIAGPETNAPPISYPLNARGWHAISIGSYTFPDATIRLAVRLSGDSAFSILQVPELEPGWTTHSADNEEFTEVFWTVADLTEKQLEIRQINWRVTPGDAPGSVQGSDATIAYVKLVPLADDEVRALQLDRDDASRRRLFAHNDAHGPHWSYRLTEADEIRRELEPYRDSDFGRIYWEFAAGDRTNYLSGIGKPATCDTAQDFGRQGDRFVAESWRIFREKGIDPLRIAVEHAHDVGLELHASYRVAGFHEPPPLPDLHDASYIAAHPEQRGMDRQGRPTPRISYSHPAARQYVLSLFREIAAYGVDGVCMFFNRRMPVLEYETPLVEGFLERYGQDPRRLDPRDPRWLAFRAETLTQFMHELRATLDEEAARLGRTTRIAVSAIVTGFEDENLFYGIDAPAWVREGLVDTLIPYSSHPAWGSVQQSWTDPADIEPWVRLTQGTGTRLAPNVMPRGLASADYRRRAGTLYDAGVENLYFWDTSPYKPGSWEGLRRLGHVDEIRAWRAAGEAELAPTTIRIRDLDGWSFETYGTGE